MLAHLWDGSIDPSGPPIVYAQEFYHGTFEVLNGKVKHCIDLHYNPNKVNDQWCRYFEF